MTLELPWHAGDHATAADGWRAVVTEVGTNGVPAEWWVLVPHNDPDDDSWPADAIPDFTDVGTGSAWLRSCAEVARPFSLGGPSLSTDERDLFLLMLAAHPTSPWAPYDPAAVVIAVTATREWLRVQGAR